MRRFAPVLVLLLGCADTEDKDPGSSTRSTAQAVTHGEPDTRHEATVRVALDRDTCSATFISSRVAVTAAHCLADGTPAAVLGADGSRVAVRAAVAMPGFDALTLERDLAVLILDAPMTARARLSEAPVAGDAVTIVGYGRIQSDDLRVGLRREGRGVVEETSEHGFVTTPGPSQPCGGDSGGAAFVTRDGQEVLVGVVSHGDARCERRAHFTRVDGEARAFLEGFADRDNAGVDPLPHEGEQGCSSSGGRPSLLGSLIAVLLLLRRRPRSTAIEPLRRGSKGARMSSIDGI